jgi:hypothetical protein
MPFILVTDLVSLTSTALTVRVMPAVDRPRVRRDAEIVEDLGVLLDDLLKRFARRLSRLMHGGADRWQHHQHKRVPGVEYGHGVNEG